MENNCLDGTHPLPASLRSGHPPPLAGEGSYHAATTGVDAHFSRMRGRAPITQQPLFWLRALSRARGRDAARSVKRSQFTVWLLRAAGWGCLAALPAVAHACAMCKGSLDDPHAQQVAFGYGLSVTTMLFVLISLFVVGGLHLVRAVDPPSFERIAAGLRGLRNRRVVMAVALGVLLWAGVAQSTVGSAQLKPPARLPVDQLVGRVSIRPDGTATGAPVGRDQLAGRAVVVTFIASWCPPCRMQVAELEALRCEFADRLAVVAVNVFETSPDLPAIAHIHSDGTVHYHPAPRPEQTIGQWLTADAILTPVIPGARALVEAFGGVSRIPTTLVFGADGGLVKHYVNDPTADFVKPELGELRKDIAAGLTAQSSNRELTH